jgi:uncharacterized damage-inducible protein DinB
MKASSEENWGEAQAQRLEKVYEQLATLLRQREIAGRVRAAGGEDEWSAMQILGHMVEMIPYWLNHCRVMIAAAAEPPQIGRMLDAPERLAGVERGAAAELDELLRQLKDEVQAAAPAIRQISAAERGKKGVHVRRGEVTVADVVGQFIVTHAEDHLAQVRAALRI